MYVIQTQLIPENDQIWVNKKDQKGNNYQYDYKSDAEDSANTLELNDIELKKYRVIEI